MQIQRPLIGVNHRARAATKSAAKPTEIPQSAEEKREFLLRNKIALWDIALSCDIVGSSDASIKNADIADLSEILATAKIEKIFLNGSLAHQLFLKKYAKIDIPYQKLPSTSPANPRYDEMLWKKALDEIFTNTH